ncbi:MAG: MFS transporter [Anaerolineae bacterium]
MTTQSSSSEGLRRFLAVLRKRDFFWLWLAQLISMVGDYFMLLAVPLLITVLAEGGSVVGPVSAGKGGELPAEAKALVGLTALAYTAPRLLGLFTGVFVDRWDRKRTIVIASGLAGLATLAPILVDSLDEMGLVIAGQFILALLTRFIQPAQQAVLPLLISDEDDLLAANGLFSINMTIGIILGPLLAGVTVATLGLRAAFIVDSISFLIAAGIVGLLVRIPALEDAPAGVGIRAVMGEIWEGVRFLFVTPILLASVISFSLLQGGLAGINLAWVPYLRETFGLGPVGITLVDAAQGAGMALGALVLGLVMSRLSKLHIAAGSLVGIGLALAGMGLAPTFLIVVLLALGLGILLTPGQSAFNTLLQIVIPKALQGRVFSSFAAITNTATILMTGIITALITVVPLRSLYIGGGIAVMLAGVLWYGMVRHDVQALKLRQQTANGSADSAAVPATR